LFIEAVQNNQLTELSHCG